MTPRLDQGEHEESPEIIVAHDKIAPPQQVHVRIQFLFRCVTTGGKLVGGDDAQALCCSGLASLRRLLRKEGAGSPVEMPSSATTCADAGKRARRSTARRATDARARRRAGQPRRLSARWTDLLVKPLHGRVGDLGGGLSGAGDELSGKAEPEARRTARRRGGVVLDDGRHLGLAFVHEWMREWMLHRGGSHPEVIRRRSCAGEEGSAGDCQDWTAAAQAAGWEE